MTVRPVTATMLRDMVVCERRVHLDIHEAGMETDPVSDFVRLLWEEGLAHEGEVLGSLPGAVVDLREVPLHARTSATLRAMESDATVILGGRLECDGLLGMPDLLLREGRGWDAGDVKAGGALHADGRRPKLEYGVQVALYARQLAFMGMGDGARAHLVGAGGTATIYDLMAPWDVDGRSLEVMAADLVSRVERIRDRAEDGRGALSATCKLCHWRTRCAMELAEADDLTAIAGLGRSARTAIEPFAPTVAALASLDLGTVTLAGGRTAIRGIGRERLGRFQDRARLLRTPGAGPYARRPLGLGRVDRELFFDIESDPLSGGLVYMHGILERTRGPDGDREDFVYFFADGPDDEERAFADAFAYLWADPDARIYYYSKFERSAYRVLQKRYPSVCTAEQIEQLYDPARAIDLLFDVVTPSTEWPTSDTSIKTLAKRLGFKWADVDPSGASSVAWFGQFTATGDPAIRERIVVYNRDDCVATRVVLDGLIDLPVRNGPEWSEPSDGSMPDDGASPPMGGHNPGAAEPSASVAAPRPEPLF